MKLMTGDIVELINISSDQLESMSSQRCERMDRTVQRAIGIIGMRYKLNIWKGYNGDARHELIGWNHGGHFVYFDKSQLRMAHRPPKNVLKSLWRSVKAGLGFMAAAKVQTCKSKSTS